MRLISGADPGFQVRGDGLKNFGVFRMKNHDFPPKNYIFSNFMGGGAPDTPPGSVPGASIQKLINIDRSKTGRNFGINR